MHIANRWTLWNQFIDKSIKYTIFELLHYRCQYLFIYYLLSIRKQRELTDELLPWKKFKPTIKMPLFADWLLSVKKFRGEIKQKSIKFFTISFGHCNQCDAKKNCSNLDKKRVLSYFSFCWHSNLDATFHTLELWSCAFFLLDDNVFFSATMLVYVYWIANNGYCPSFHLNTHTVH